MSQLIVTMAEEKLAKEKEEKLVGYAMFLLRDNEEDEQNIKRAQDRIESRNESLDKITRGDETFISKILFDINAGRVPAISAYNSNVSGNLR